MTQRFKTDRTSETTRELSVLDCSRSRMPRLLIRCQQRAIVRTRLSITSQRLVVVLAVIASACGGASTASSPSAAVPTTTSTVTSVSVVGPDAVKIGPFAQHRIAATLSDGSTQQTL